MLLLLVSERELIIEILLYGIPKILSKCTRLSLILLPEVYELTYVCYALCTLIQGD
jgi:hypothetical protein